MTHQVPITPDRVREIFEGLESGDGAGFFEHVAEDVDWTVMGTHPLAGRYLNKAAFIAGTFAKLGRVLPNGTQLRTEHLTVADDEAVVELRSFATAKNGMRFDNRYCWIVYFRNEVIVRVRAYLDSAMVTRLFQENPAQDTESGNERAFQRVLYTAKAHSTGGRDGASRTSDGRLDIKLSTPGTSATGTNPEQLFAAGWSACFLSAIKIIAAKTKVALPAEPFIDAEIDLGMTHGAFGLVARLSVSLPGMERHAAEDLVAAAHQLCPYSRATRGNIDVAINVVTSVDPSTAIHQTEEIHP